MFTFEDKIIKRKSKIDLFPIRTDTIQTHNNNRRKT